MFERSPDAVIEEMKHYNIKTVAGCLTRVTCDITAPEGVDTTLTAFLVYEGESRPATLESADVIIFPAVPYGHYAYEIRCGGKPVAFGHLLVRPSAFPHTDGVVDYSLAVDLSTAEAAHVELTLTPGPRGPKGDTGASAYDIATEHGYQGSEADWVAELSGAQAAASAAKASEQAAATAAASAASTLNAAAKKTENNTFSGTNTFNGTLVANGGITGLPARGTGSNAVCANAMGLLSLVETGLTRCIPLTWGTPVGNMEVTNGEQFVVSQNKTGYVRSAAVRPYGLHSINISFSGDIFIPLKMAVGVNNGHVRVDVLFSTGGWSYNEQPSGWPLDLASLKNEKGSAGISLEVRRDTSAFAARVILRAVGYPGAETTSGLTVTEREYNVQGTNYNPFFVGNQSGLLGVLLARDSEDTNKMVVLLLCGWAGKKVVYRLATIPFGLSVQGGHTLRLQVAGSNTGTVYLPCLYYRERCGSADVFVDAATALGAKDLSSVATEITDISESLADYIANTTANE